MSLRTYEALFIVSPELEDDAIQAVASTVESIVTGQGGSTVRLDIWGKRRLAYPVKKHNEGCYVLFRFDAESAVLAKLETHFKLTDEIIRHLVVFFDEQTLRAEAEQIARREEEIRSGADRRRDDDDDDDDDDRPRRPRGRSDYDDD